MDDKNLMESLLQTTKGISDLYLHGTIEAANENVRCAFDSSLNRTLQMQKQIYDKMVAKGWYTNQNAEQTKITQARQKFANG